MEPRIDTDTRTSFDFFPKCLCCANILANIVDTDWREQIER